MKKYLLVTLLILLSISCRKGIRIVQSTTQQGAFTTNSDIELYLREIFTDDLGFTLLGEKPISFIECYSLKSFSEAKNRMLDFLQTTFYNSPRFILKIFEVRPRLYTIILVHKNALNQIILEEPILNEFVVEKFGEVQNLLDNLADPQNDLFSTFDADPILLGIVLGYGKENSEFFFRRSEIGRYLGKFPLRSMPRVVSHPTLFSFYPARDMHIQAFLSRQCCHLDATPKSCSNKFASLEQEWSWIEENTMPIHNDLPPVLFKVPVFIACKSHESKEKIRKFTTAMTRLVHLFEKKKVSVVIEEEAQKS